jgi:hypothetical protein
MKRADGADPAYWTAYDYHMMERDARAMQRAHVYTAVARFARILYWRTRWGIRHLRSTVTARPQRWTSST